jgi:Domain of unknown function (DUF1877)
MGMIFSYMPVEQLEIDMLLGDPNLAFEFLEENDERSSDIDKAWHGIHYLLTGDAILGEFPLSFILNGGQVISGDELPTIRVFRREEVQLIAHALLQSKRQSLKERFDPKAMKLAQVYPDIWGNGDGELDYLKENFELLCQDFKTIAADEKALVTCIG